ncbi:MAG: dethiobiotin synthase [Verrucomicrobia bacterium]|nr:dethiobiotin synthase [Verrucomicrobiota bacterium]
MTGFFITGTDTGIGKTVVAGSLLSALRAEGIDAVPMKPVQTGCETRDGQLIAPDIEVCLSAAGLEVTPEEMADMVPYSFEPACSPHLAAEFAGTVIDLSVIKDAFDRLSARHDSVVVEGAGGVLVPLTRTGTMLDLMKLLDLPVILTARPSLGTLNHTLLSLAALRDSGIEVLGVVLVHTSPDGDRLVEDDNRKTIEQMGRIRILGEIPYSDRAVPLAADIWKKWIETLYPARSDSQSSS